MESKIILLDEFRKKKYDRAINKNRSKYKIDEEERKETLDLFIKVLETIEKEARFKV